MAINAIRVSGLATGAVLVVLMALSQPVLAESINDRCAAAAQAFIDSLTPEQRATTAVSFETDARKQWIYRPGSELRKEGLAIGEMSADQRIEAHRLIACAMSTQGYMKAVAIMHLDDIVAEHFHETVMAVLPGPYDIGHDFFWVAVFGDPSGDEPWGWQLEGHHLVLNFTVVDGEIAVTPAFMGAEPATVDRGPLAGWRVLGNEVDLAFALVASLDDEQREAVVLSDEVPLGLSTGQAGKGDALDEYQGLRGSDMSAVQQEMLWALIREYTNNADARLADAHLQRISADGLEQVWFAWMGDTTPGGAAYYRIHGPSVIIEFGHGQNLRSKKRSPDPNHSHAVYRDPRYDHGEDLLRRHYAESPHHQ